MGKRASFTAAELERAIKTARKIDRASIVEVTRDGTIRIMRAQKQPQQGTEVDDWFNGQG